MYGQVMGTVHPSTVRLIMSPKVPTGTGRERRRPSYGRRFVDGMVGTQIVQSVYKKVSVYYSNVARLLQVWEGAGSAERAAESGVYHVWWSNVER